MNRQREAVRRRDRPMPGDAASRRWWWSMISGSRWAALRFRTRGSDGGHTGLASDHRDAGDGGCSPGCGAASGGKRCRPEEKMRAILFCRSSRPRKRPLVADMVVRAADAAQDFRGGARWSRKSTDDRRRRCRLRRLFIQHGAFSAIHVGKGTPLLFSSPPGEYWRVTLSITVHREVAYMDKAKRCTKPRSSSTRRSTTRRSTASSDAVQDTITQERRRGRRALNKWGRKRLAYSINKKTNGFYVNLEFDASCPAARAARALVPARRDDPPLPDDPCSITRRSPRARRRPAAAAAAAARIRQPAPVQPAASRCSRSPPAEGSHNL